MAADWRLALSSPLAADLTEVLDCGFNYCESNCNIIRTTHRGNYLHSIGKVMKLQTVNEYHGNAIMPLEGTPGMRSAFSRNNTYHRVTTLPGGVTTKSGSNEEHDPRALDLGLIEACSEMIT